MSVGGLFTHCGHNQGRAFHVHRVRDGKRKLNEFAEMLAEGVAPADAAVELGHTPPYGRVLLQRLIKGLGKEQCR
jgi:hypothetical protein